MRIQKGQQCYTCCCDLRPISLVVSPGPLAGQDAMMGTTHFDTSCHDAHQRRSSENLDRRSKTGPSASALCKQISER
eukprot:445172-Amphidinium_carterae.1